MTVQLWRAYADEEWARITAAPDPLQLPDTGDLPDAHGIDLLEGRVPGHLALARRHRGRDGRPSRADFARVCGHPETLGTCPVRVTVLGRIAPPETDADG